ncbi:hypothetical protein IEQ34_020064 [Dendrobium chrysotoxum]|uniref:Uncharacterized protein n=1 Tax=Dendrobium chrysotoxum TaxID=161865 RepID=A0AAV7G1F5_DENCH|nr:hypothetical protein IEQ34_020064 [Dendrobium chrysotoxum]
MLRAMAALDGTEPAFQIGNGENVIRYRAREIVDGGVYAAEGREVGEAGREAAGKVVVVELDLYDGVEA